MEEQPLAEESEFIELEPDLPPGQEPEDDAPAKRRIKRSAVQQGSLIPQGWKPSLRKPVPVVRCNYIFHDKHERAGERCMRWSLRGSLLCYTHGGRGNLKHAEEYRLAIIESARLQLIEGAGDAVDTMLYLMRHSGADNVRLKAATEVLDRVGIKTADQLEVDVTVTEASPAAALAQRLDKLKKAAEFVAAKEEEQRRAEEEQLALPAGTAVIEVEDAEVIDGEVVEDSD